MAVRCYNTRQAEISRGEFGLFLEEPAVSPDGRYLAYCRSHGGSSIWLLTLGADLGDNR